MTGKAKRRREKERKRMLDSVREEIEANGVVTVFNCSGTKEHRIQCDGECGTTDLNELDILLMDESGAWERAGMNTQNVVVDQFILETKVLVLTKLVEEKMGIELEELNHRFKTQLLERLTQIRKENEDNVRAQRIAAGKPSIILPGGERLH